MTAYHSDVIFSKNPSITAKPPDLSPKPTKEQAQNALNKPGILQEGNFKGGLPSLMAFGFFWPRKRSLRTKGSRKAERGAQ